ATTVPDDDALLAELQVLDRALVRHAAWLAADLAPWLGRSLLEVGSGLGSVSRHLVARGVPTILSDRHPAALAALRTRFAGQPHVTVMAFDLAQPPAQLPHAVDTIVALNVIEHLDDDAAALATLRALLPPGGRLVLQVPHHPRLRGSLDATYGHRRRYDR